MRLSDASVEIQANGFVSQKIVFRGGAEGETPYYAILEDANLELYRRYRARVEDLVNFHCVGRLAEYRYYDMDGVVASALDLSDEIISQHS